MTDVAHCPATWISLGRWHGDSSQMVESIALHGGHNLCVLWSAPGNRREFSVTIAEAKPHGRCLSSPRVTSGETDGVVFIYDTKATAVAFDVSFVGSGTWTVSLYEQL